MVVYNLEDGLLNKRLVDIALVIASVFFSLLTLEVGLRAYVGLPTSKEIWPYLFTYQLTNFRNHWIVMMKGGRQIPAAFDPELGWIPKQGVWGDNDRGTVVTIVEDGIRSNGSGEVPDTTEPILGVGDSFTFGAQVSDWETWPAQLEKLSGTKVINAGVFGFGIDQAFLRARRLLSRYRFSTVIFSFIPDDIHRCKLSERDSAFKPYFDIKNGRLTLENVPVPSPPPKESEPLRNALGHSQLVHSVMKRLFPDWWLGWREIQVQNQKKGGEVACALLHELEELTNSRGSELIILVQHEHEEAVSESMAVERALRCLSDPTTRLLDLKPALAELKAKDPSRYDRLYNGHMTAEGNQFVALELSKILSQR